jgi:hypothetical protein
MRDTPATCACGVQRAADDPGIVGLMFIAGVSRPPHRPLLRACRNCGVVYIAELAGVAGLEL